MILISAYCRVKDMACVLHILTNIPLLHAHRMQAVSTVLEELQKPGRQAERQNFFGCLLQIAISLTNCGIYPHWLIEDVFRDSSQEKFLSMLIISKLYTFAIGVYLMFNIWT